MRGFLRQVMLGWSGVGAAEAAEAGEAPVRLAQDDRKARARRRQRRVREAKQARARARVGAGAAADLDAYGQVIRLTAEAPHLLAGDRTHVLADTVFDVAAGYPDRIGIEVGDRAVIDVLRVRIRPGVTGIDRFIRLGEGARVGLIDVEAADQTDPTDEKQDGFLQIRVADVRIDALGSRTSTAASGCRARRGSGSGPATARATARA